MTTRKKETRDNCWVCSKTPRKYFTEHHVVGVANDPDLTVWLCRGCHGLEFRLSRVKFLADAKAVGRLLTLARMHAGLPDARTVVRYEYNDGGVGCEYQPKENF